MSGLVLVGINLPVFAQAAGVRTSRRGTFANNRALPCAPPPQRTEFLPSAYLLIQPIVVIIIAALAFTEKEATYEAVIILAFISFFFVALLRLLRIMDRPFHVEEHTPDDVSLFLLRRFVEALDRSRA